MLLKLIRAILLSQLCWVSAQAGSDHESPSKLALNLKNYELKDIEHHGKSMRIRAYENVTYVSNPSDSSSQRMNIYIPEGYFHNEVINRFNAQQAPIFFPNQIGGYMPSQPVFLGRLPTSSMGPHPSDAAIKEALSRGFVIAIPGTRGRTSQNSEGKYIGKSSAGIVDLKAAVRFLRLNDSIMPGDAEKIISNGTSAGGALSALLGASGNSEDYSAELKEIGAASARDDIYAVSAYCPITDLEHADAAYEWQFDGIYDYKKIDITMLDYKIQRKEIAGSMSSEQIAVSKELKKLYPAYVNGLSLKSDEHSLNLDTNGNGSFKNYISKLIANSAQNELNKGDDLSGYSWIVIDKNKVVSIDWNAYIKQLGRQKTAPAFDGLALETGENQLFGDEQTDKLHFTEFSKTKDQAGFGMVADQSTVNKLNPLHYIKNAKKNIAQYWRIRHGTKDKDTSLAVPTLLSLTLSNHNIPVDYELAWDKPHSGDYDLDDLFNWAESTSRIK